MKLIISTSLIFVIAVFVLPGILSFGVVNIPDRVQPSLDKTQKLYRDLLVSQTFISKNTKLSAIGVSLKNPNLANKKDVILSLYENSILIRQSVLNGSQIEDGNFVKFKFEPTDESENKAFSFTLTAPATTQQEADASNALEVFLTDQKDEGVGELIVGDKVFPYSSISFVSFYKPPYATYVLESIYSKWLNKLMSDWQFFLSYTVLILILGGFLLLQFSKSRRIH